MADPSRPKRCRHTTSLSVVLKASLSDSERTGTLKKLLSSSTENLCARVKEGHLSFSVAYDAPPRVVFVDLVHRDASIDAMLFAANALPRSVR